MPPIAAIQEELRAAGLDGWLFYDFHHRDPIAGRVLGLNGSAGSLGTRRWFYLIPARGTPRKLVHRIESSALDALPGRKLIYASLAELETNLSRLIGPAKRVAMQYSRRNAIPYVSMVDAGTVELVRAQGCRVESSADLVQQWILAQFRNSSIVAEEPPIVAAGAHSGDPHYEPRPKGSSRIRAGDLLLLDVWGKLDRPGSVYYDITWVGYLGAKVPEKYTRIFAIVCEARDRAIAFVQRGLAAGRAVHGWQVDRAARDVIGKAGYGKYFVHRTGHSIGQDVHGNGANMDGLETRDVRRVLPRSCFSVEPGIYLPEFGVRSEVNVYVDGIDARVTGPVQTGILPLLA